MLAGLDRLRCPELMDDPALDRGQHERALRALNGVNRWLGVERRMRQAVGRFGPISELSVADVGAGGGGLLSHLDRARHRSPLRVAVDISPFALQRAREWSDGAVRGVVADALRLPLGDGSVDVVTCSLFLHQFDEPDGERILREMARVAAKGIVVDDLVRSRLSLAATWAATHAVSHSPVFRNDGPVSVRAAYRPAELAEMAERAGLGGAEVHRHFPFRMLLVWRKRPEVTR